MAEYPDSDSDNAARTDYVTGPLHEAVQMLDNIYLLSRPRLSTFIACETR